MPKTYLGRRQPLSRPVICSAQPQSEPGTGWGTAIVRTTGFPLGDMNTRRAAIRRMVRGAANDLLIAAERDRIRPGREAPLSRAATSRSGSNRRRSGPPFLLALRASENGVHRSAARREGGLHRIPLVVGVSISAYFPHSRRRVEPHPFVPTEDTDPISGRLSRRAILHTAAA